MSDTERISVPRPPAVGRPDRIAEVRAVGRWMPWAAFVLAVLWWGCVAAALVTSIDLNVLLGQPPITIAAVGVMALLPGLLILMAGFMARESARGALANTLVLRAAGQLLQPADAMAGETESLAARLATSASEVDQSMSQALSAMKALSSEIGDERLRLESVSYATADNARDLSAQLGRERSAMEELIRDLRGQSDTMNEAIPRQAQHMVEAARLAAEEIGRADAALDSRLSAMRQASQSLGDELYRLNQMAEDAGTQSEALMHAIARVEDKLDHSKQTVDAAIRASEAAVAAAGSTGEALQSAVSSALDDARRASLEIQKRTRESSEEAAMQIQVLRQSAEQAGASLKAVGMAARAESDLTEKRLSQTADGLKRAVQPTENGFELPVDRPVSPPPIRKETPPAPEPDPLFASPPPRPAPARSFDSDLFETTQESPPPPPRVEKSVPELRRSFDAPPPPISAMGAEESRPDRDIPPPFDPLDEIEPEHEPNALPAPGIGHENGAREAGWSSILSDMDRNENGDMSRETTAETVIRRLESAGMTLANIFRPKDKRRIATAARKGEAQRRNATRSAAKFELDRVTTRLMGDAEFVTMAHEFVALETADAVAALDRTQKSNRNASPRLSAFLLLDAALGG